ncbi:MAG: lipoyl synthase [Candidatus Omnitrophica bacterium]|nr:lipoyl synthase [Candidatus Omnitrophota bacterium]MDD5662391.1 lipoyl synthase [Candidatus Omnitrophota bacterium]
MNRLPSWLKQDIPDALVWKTAGNIYRLGVDTVCQQALCPNLNFCFKRKQAAFMILGKYCTRSCRFCNISGNVLKLPQELSSDEPERIARAVRLLELKYAVITSVTRDDLEDGGALQFMKVIESIRSADKTVKVEVLIPDFQGNGEALRKIVNCGPFVLAHNLETIERLYSVIRPQAHYRRSLRLLAKAKELGGRLITKSSLMLGFGETKEEVKAALKDLRSSGCDIVTLGQYLAPSSRHYPVKEFILPEQFREYSALGLSLGFKRVLSGPKIRSSYDAEELSLPAKQAGKQEVLSYA